MDLREIGCGCVEWTMTMSVFPTYFLYIFWLGPDAFRPLQGHRLWYLKLLYTIVVNDILIELQII
jgi:hypothetical protein